MNIKIENAIKDFKAAQNEYAAAKAAAKAAEKYHAATIEKCYKNGKFVKSEEARAAIKATGKAYTDANQDLKHAEAVILCASQNVANAAANVLSLAILSDPAKFNMPTHYKKFNAAVNNVLGSDFYFCASDYSFYIYFKSGSYNHNSAYITDKTEGKLNIDRIRANRSVMSLSDIKAEVKEAAEEAARLTEAAEALKAADKEARAKFKSHVKDLMPHINFDLVKDDYRLF